HRQGISVNQGELDIATCGNDGALDNLVAADKCAATSIDTALHQRPASCINPGGSRSRLIAGVHDRASIDSASRLPDAGLSPRTSPWIRLVMACRLASTHTFGVL